jgi:transposase-like protein
MKIIQKEAPKTAHYRIHQMSVAQFEKQFPNEDSCKRYLVSHRWPDGVRCPRCGNENVHELKAKPFHWNCYQCSPDSGGYHFSVLVKTIFENTNKSLREWFRVMHLMLTAKKGISALQIMRYMGFGSYKTAWGMCQKIRVALGSPDFKQLIGYAETDETFVGGKYKNMHKNKRPPGGQGGSGNKAVLAGAVQRKGNVIARVVANTRRETLEAFVRYAVSTDVSLLSTDESSAYSHLKEYRHGFVRHSAGQYVHGAIHTNTIEGFWSMVKRGIIGSYHKVSAKYLQLYVNEFEFRYNNRENEDIFGSAMKACA